MLRRIEHDITIDIPFWAQARLLAGRSDACGLDPPRTQGLGLLRTNQGGHAMSTSTLYAATAKFGHFGRTGEGFTWEKTDKAAALKAAAAK